MDYVQKAIEKAREERQGNVGGEQSAAKPAAAKPAPGDAQAGPQDALTINYTHTRKVELSDSVLVNNRIVAAFENDERAEPYRQLRTQILQKFRDNNWRTLAITSAHQDAGKTLTAINLAVALSKEVNQTVLLADMDFKGPNILEGIGIQASHGFVEYLKGEVELQEILVNPGLDRLSILPALPVEGNTSEILSSPAMKAALEDIVGRYSDRIIVFDLPPLLRDDDALVFTPYVDSTLLVIEEGVTTPAEVERCVSLLEGTELIGTVLNKAL